MKTNVVPQPLEAPATNAAPGYMTAGHVQTLEALAGPAERLNLRTPVRNETGSPIPKGTLLAIVGFSSGEMRPLVAPADKDDPDLRPAVAMADTAIPDGTNVDAMVVGTVVGLDTSGFELTDQLVLGNAGAISRPPPDVSPFTGEVQLIGSVSRVHASDGQIICAVAQGLLPLSASAIFAARGSSGTPSDANQFVTASDPRLPSAGQAAALAGTSGTPGAGNRFVTAADAAMTNARAPTAHASTHATGGTDAVAPSTIGAEATANKGVASGYCPLDADAVVPSVNSRVQSVAGKIGAVTIDHATDLSNAGAASHAVIDAQLPSAGQKAALAGTTGTPGSGNLYVTNSDARNTDARTPTAHAASHVGGGSDAIAIASDSAAGLLSVANKAKIDALPTAFVPGFIITFGFTLALTGTNFLLPGSGSVSATEVKLPLPRAGFLRNMRVYAGTGPGAGTVTFTARRSAAASPSSTSDTALTVALTGSGVQTVADTTHAVTWSAGDLLSISVVIPALSPVANVVVTVEWTAV